MTTPALRRGAAPPQPLTGAFGVPYRFPYQLGVYMAVNAISDAVLMVDGPDCVIRKAQWLQGKHDWQATLLDVLGRHRIVPTLLHADRVVKSRGEDVVDRLRRIDQHRRAGLILVCAMPHVSIIGTQYDQLLRDAQPHTRAQLIEVPSLSLQGDWLHGYAETLLALAGSLDLSGGMPAPERVAVVGHVMDRLEEDQRANVAELRRLLEALSLDVVSVWLDGGTSQDLGAVRHAGTLVALPHGLRAARRIAASTGATVVEAPVPLGIPRTRRLLLAVGRATGRLDAAEALVERELALAVPRFARIVDHLLAGRRIAYSGDPATLGGMLQVAAEVGMEVVGLASPAAASHAGDLADELGEPIEVAWQPRAAELTSLHERVADADLLIGDGHFLQAAVAPPDRFVELGFPSLRYHALHPAPTLGFSGWTCLMHRLTNATLARAAR